METTARLYNCVRCHCQVQICCRCDRGNIYCGNECAKTARTQSLREAGTRYQKTAKGARYHAARQQRYRQQENKKVTHHGSNSVRDNTPSKSPDICTKPGLIEATSALHCDFCNHRVADFLRTNYLNRSSPGSFALKSLCAQGP